MPSVSPSSTQATVTYHTLTRELAVHMPQQAPAITELASPEKVEDALMQLKQDGWQIKNDMVRHEVRLVALERSVR